MSFATAKSPPCIKSQKSRDQKKQLYWRWFWIGPPPLDFVTCPHYEASTSTRPTLLNFSALWPILVWHNTKAWVTQKNAFLLADIRGAAHASFASVFDYSQPPFHYSWLPPNSWSTAEASPHLWHISKTFLCELGAPAAARHAGEVAWISLSAPWKQLGKGRMTLRFTVNHQGFGHEPPVVSLSIHKSGNLSLVHPFLLLKVWEGGSTCPTFRCHC